MTVAARVEADVSVPDPIVGGADDVDAVPDWAEVELSAIAGMGPLEEAPVLGVQGDPRIANGVAMLIDDPPTDHDAVAFGSGTITLSRDTALTPPNIN